jgi:SAM-dependent methyltransferase
VPAAERDAYADALLGIDGLAEDGPDLPRGCVPYVPCSVEVLLRTIDVAGIRASDVFVDIGSGIGRAAVLTHLATGAAAIGIEVQPALVRASRELAARCAARASFVEGDAAELVGRIATGTVFFFYCPFSGERLDRALAALESLARGRALRICTVDLPIADRAWLERLTPPGGDLAVFRSRSRG